MAWVGERQERHMELDQETEGVQRVLEPNMGAKNMEQSCPGPAPLPIVEKGEDRDVHGLSVPERHGMEPALRLECTQPSAVQLRQLIQSA